MDIQCSLSSPRGGWEGSSHHCPRGLGAGPGMGTRLTPHHHGGPGRLWSLDPKGRAPPLPDGPSLPAHSPPPASASHPFFNKSLSLSTPHPLACLPVPTPGTYPPSPQRGNSDLSQAWTGAPDLPLSSGGLTLPSLSCSLCEMGTTRPLTCLPAFRLVFPGPICSCH